ncbi:MAG: hypothetical protein JSR45_07095 [Proteobacteria bacterium]|nr:hypothetical protein [Pseudomonadota bacterium]
MGALLTFERIEETAVVLLFAGLIAATVLIVRARSDARLRALEPLRELLKHAERIAEAFESPSPPEAMTTLKWETDVRVLRSHLAEHSAEQMIADEIMRALTIYRENPQSPRQYAQRLTPIFNDCEARLRELITLPIERGR